MKHLLLGAALALGLFAFLCGSADSQEKKSSDTFTDPNQAGIDFKIQGEYAGEVPGSGKLGCQVIALSPTAFQAVLLPGGLPGDGWDGKNKVLLQGKLDGDKAVFEPAKGTRKYLAGGPETFSATVKFPPEGQKDYSAVISGDTLTGKTDEDKSFELKKVLRKSPTLGDKPPEGALVLFDGSNAAEWNGGKLVEENLLNCGTSSKKDFGVGKLHIEFRTPYQPKARGQGRGNSGVYVHNNEIQVLDSFGLDGEKNECGAFYGRAKPTVNMCLPPLSWQTYDVEAKTGKEGEILLTVWHNGVKVHDLVGVKGNAEKGASINLQNHGNPVHYRNIWIAPVK